MSPVGSALRAQRPAQAPIPPAEGPRAPAKGAERRRRSAVSLLEETENRFPVILEAARGKRAPQRQSGHTVLQDFILDHRPYATVPQTPVLCDEIVQLGVSEIAQW